MDFKKYESIANDNNTRTIEYYRENGLTTGMWYATEKVHGANFSFISDGVTVQYARRGEVLQPGESFMGYENFLGDFPDKVKVLANHLGTTIQVVTEFYGQGVVNKGAIKYRNNDKKGFVAFDILDLNTDTYIEHFHNFDLLDLFQIPRVSIFKTGTFEELLAMNLNWKSVLAASNDVVSNVEGIVLKPYKDTRTETGERVILKRVTAEFAENRPVMKEKKVVVYEEIGDANKVLIQMHNTDVRLGKVAAKFGILPTDKSKFATLLIELAKDINSEFEVALDEKLVKAEILSTVKSYFN
jgi:Rnl2 family RNA ligase